MAYVGDDLRTAVTDIRICRGQKGIRRDRHGLRGNVLSRRGQRCGVGRWSSVEVTGCQAACGHAAGDPPVAWGCMAGEIHAVDLLPAGPAAAAARIWAGLDKPWQEAFRQAWEALRTGNIAVGACAATRAGEIVCSARNRVNDGDGPPGGDIRLGARPR